MTAIPSSRTPVEQVELLELLDWKRRIFALYADVRAASNPHHAWQHWRDVRDALFRSHRQTPIAAAARGGFERLEYFPYDPSLRMLADVFPTPHEERAIAGSAGS